MSEMSSLHYLMPTFRPGLFKMAQDITVDQDCHLKNGKSVT